MAEDIDFAALWRSGEPMRSFRETRHSVMIHATLKCGSSAASARVRNISSGGMMAECRFRGEPGERVTIAMRGVGEVSGLVAWAAQDRIGVQFDRPIDPLLVLRKPPAAGDISFVPRPVQRTWRPPLHVS